MRLEIIVKRPNPINWLISDNWNRLESLPPSPTAFACGWKLCHLKNPFISKHNSMIEIIVHSHDCIIRITNSLQTIQSSGSVEKLWQSGSFIISSFYRTTSSIGKKSFHTTLPRSFQAHPINQNLWRFGKGNFFSVVRKLLSAGNELEKRRFDWILEIAFRILRAFYGSQRAITNLAQSFHSKLRCRLQTEWNVRKNLQLLTRKSTHKFQEISSNFPEHHSTNRFSVSTLPIFSCLPIQLYKINPSRSWNR